MTHAKSPIDKEALANRLVTIKNFIATTCDGGSPKWVEDLADAITSLRASTGKMKPAEEWYNDAPGDVMNPGIVMRDDCIDFIKRIQADALASAQPEPRPLPECEWVDDPDGYWKTSCGHAFYLSDGTPADNNIEWCCYCGGSMIPKPTVTL